MTDLANPVLAFFKPLIPLSKEQQTCLVAAFKSNTFKEGTVLFAGDSICRELYFVHSGVLKILNLNDRAEDVVYFFVQENQFCTILYSFQDGVKAAEKIIAATDAAVWGISKQRLDQLYEEIPALKPVIDRLNQQRLMEKVQLRNSFAGKDATARYKLFLNLYPRLALRVSLQDIASFLDITPQSLSRIRKSLATH